MLFNIPFLADWNKIGDHRQHHTDLNTESENCSCCDWDYKVGDKVLLRKDGIIRKSVSQYECDPWTITSVHTNGTIRVQCGPKIKTINHEESNNFSNIRFNSHKCYFYGLSPSPTQHRRFTKFMTDSTVCLVTQGMDDI